MVSDYKELCARLRMACYCGELQGAGTCQPCLSADAIEAQAREIAELRAEVSEYDPSCGCEFDPDEKDGHAPPVIECMYHKALRARAEAAEKAIKEHNDGCVAACEARQRGDYGQDCSAWISRKRRCLDCARDSMIDYPAAIAAGGDDAKD